MIAFLEDLELEVKKEARFQEVNLSFLGPSLFGGVWKNINHIRG